jgi:hypothetical protein
MVTHYGPLIYSRILLILFYHTFELGGFLRGLRGGWRVGNNRLLMNLLSQLDAKRLATLNVTLLLLDLHEQVVAGSHNQDGNSNRNGVSVERKH